jgi:hypothetical protein
MALGGKVIPVLGPQLSVHAVDGSDGRRFAKRSQSGNRLRLGADEDIGELAVDNSDASFEVLIAFFTVLQITSREKGFSRKSKI